VVAAGRLFAVELRGRTTMTMRVCCRGNGRQGDNNDTHPPSSCRHSRRCPVLFGVVLVVSYFYYVSPEAGGSIVHTRVLWGGIMCI
jgi:hypothetical protein